MNLEALRQPLSVGKKTAVNRVVVQPLERNDADSSGGPSEITIERYCKLAEGGAAIIFIEATTISSKNRARVNQLCISEDTAGGFAKLFQEMRVVNDECLILVQLDHAGRFADPTLSELVSVYPSSDPSVHVLTEEELEETGERFTKAAQILAEAGADGIDLKHGHSFLLAELLQPANSRDGQYGGSFENRTRLFKKIVRQMKSDIPDESFIIGVRMCAYEPILGGFGTAGPGQVIEDLREPIAFAQLIESEGLDYISVSGGTVGGNYEVIMPTKVYPEGVFRHFGWTKAIKNAVNIPVIGAGYSYLRDGKNDITESDPNKKSAFYWAEKNLKDGNVDLVGFGRQGMADPLFPRKAFSGDLDAINYCTTCMGCGALLGGQQRVGCVVYDDYYRKLFAQTRDE